MGPDLQGIAGGCSPAGRLENTPAQLIRWIRHPQAIVPGNAMPELGIPEQEAPDMAADLYILR